MRVLIVDDERIARNRLRVLLESEPDVVIAGECGNGRDAIAALAKSDADVVFLDIQMPGTDGFGVLRNLPREHTPIVVFVTAYDKYALQAFEVRAFDYLLKPFDRERLQQTLHHLRDELARTDRTGSGDRLQSLVEMLERRNKLDRIAVRNKGRVLLVKTETIDWVEAADNYVCLHCGRTTHVMRETLAAIESRLDPMQFIRIHRSAIVNADRIAELQPWFHGDYRVLLHDGTTLTMSRNFRERVEGMLHALG